MARSSYVRCCPKLISMEKASRASMGLSHTHHRQRGPGMRSFKCGQYRQQASFLRRKFLQDGDLPFTDVFVRGGRNASVESVEGRLARPRAIRCWSRCGSSWAKC